MINYILKCKTVLPLTKNKPKNVIVLCHGYGGDGEDISSLAISWQRFLPDAIFLCPNAPEACSVNPQGYQWFDLTSEKEEIILKKSLFAEEKLSIFLDQVLENYQLSTKNLALVGFSQGCMISIQVGIKKKVNCIVGYSGKIINQNYLSKNIHSKPKIFLMHGLNDIVVPPTHLLEAKEYFNNLGIKIKTKFFKNCEHKIPTEGVSLGLDFLKKNLL